MGTNIERMKEMNTQQYYENTGGDSRGTTAVLQEIFSKEFCKELEEDYRWLHANAEVGFELDETFRYVEKRLRDAGCNPIPCGRKGLVATIGPHAEKGAFLLRADMDGLAMREMSGVPYASEKGTMHACGHDAHTAMLLGAVRWLKKHEAQLKGCVKVMFQPAEEVLEGSADMMAAGVLHEPEVKGAMMIHVMCGVPVMTGTRVVSDAGVGAPAADFYSIEIRGAGCHASMPHQGKDPLTTAAHLLVALDAIRAKEIDYTKKAVLTIGALEGAVSANVIPDRIVLRGSMRAFDEEVRGYMKKRLGEMVVGMGTVFSTPAEVTFTGGAPTLYNDAELSKKCYEILCQSKTGKVMRSSDFPGGNSGGSEDFAYVSQAVPSVMLALAAGDSREGYAYQLHHPKMRVDLRALPYGTDAFCRMALEYWL